MNDAPLVSAIVIFLNEERFLAQAIGSVLAQSHANWELLLVDDGSTDGSSVIARDFAARDPRRIRCYEHAGHANRGMSASRTGSCCWSMTVPRTAARSSRAISRHGTPVEFAITSTKGMPIAA